MARMSGSKIWKGFIVREQIQLIYSVIRCRFVGIHTQPPDQEPVIYLFIKGFRHGL